MTNRTIRANLGQATFPLVSDFSGRTVIIPGLDQTYNKAMSGGGGDVDKEIGMPQVFYMHNCIPTGNGYKSVGYRNSLPAHVPAVTDFDSVHTLRDEQGKTVLFCPAGGLNYIYNPNDNAWTSTNPLVSGTFASSSFVTVARVKGRSIVFYERVNAYEYDFVAKTFDVVTLAGLTVANIKGLCASSNYLIAYDDAVIYWSSTSDIFDFVPSLITGAGSETPTDLRGQIVTVLPITGGFIIYTNENAVLATYSGNLRFPWLFKEIPNSAGVTSPENVCWNANLSFHYAYTTAGVMKVDRGTAEIAFPELTDFFSHRIFEDFDETTETFTTQYPGGVLAIKMTFVGSRYLIASYGLVSYTHALIFDTALKRWGKLKITHTDCFELPALPKFGELTYEELEPQSYEDLGATTYAQLSEQQLAATTPKHDIGFLLSTGEVLLLVPGVAAEESSGVFVIGKYQMTRDKMCRFLQLSVENLFSDDPVTVKLLTTWSGKKFKQNTTLTQMPQEEGDLARIYKAVVVGENHSIMFKGRFNLVSMQLEVNAAGR